MKRVPLQVVPFLILLLGPLMAWAQQPGFVPNQGQWDGSFTHALFTQGFGLYVENGGWTVDAWSGPEHDHAEDPGHSHPPQGSFAYRQSFVGSTAQPLWEQQEVNPTPLNYLTGPDPSRWATNLKAANRLVARNYYTGIHL